MSFEVGRFILVAETFQLLFDSFSLVSRLATKLKQITEDYEAREGVSLMTVFCCDGCNLIGRPLNI